MHLLIDPAPYDSVLQLFYPLHVSFSHTVFHLYAFLNFATLAATHKNATSQLKQPQLYLWTLVLANSYSTLTLTFLTAN